MNCIICLKELTGRQTKYCSRKCGTKDGNFKHQVYVCQRERAVARKLALIKPLGAKCAACGYNKNLAVLSFHHRDPSQKTHQLDTRKLSNSTWDWCVQEAAKCDLLCLNCHGEHHNPHLGLAALLAAENGPPGGIQTHDPRIMSPSL